MPTRVAWEDQYALSFRTTAIGASDAATSGLFAATGKGIPGADLFGFLIDEHPPIEAGVEIVTTEKTTGLAQKQTSAAAIGTELMIPRKMPTFSVGSMGMTEDKMEVLFWSLFQKGATEATTPFPVNFVPYVQGQPDPEMYLDISRNIGDPASATGYGHLIAGALCTQIAVSGSQGERYNVSAEFIGRTFRSDYIHTASVFTAETEVDHAFLDYSWTIAGSAASLQSIEFTIANNAVPVYYNSLVVSSYTLHRMTLTGSMALAMSTSTIGDNTQIDNYVAGTDVLIVGTHSSTKIVYTINAHYTGAPIDPAETELLITLPMEGAYDGTNHIIEIDTATGIERGIPA